MAIQSLPADQDVRNEALHAEAEAAIRASFDAMAEAIEQFNVECDQWLKREASQNPQPNQVCPTVGVGQ